MPLTTNTKATTGLIIINSIEVITQNSIIVTIPDKSDRFESLNILFDGLINVSVASAFVCYFNNDLDNANYESNTLFQNNKNSTGNLLDDNLSIIEEDDGIFLGRNENGNGADILINFNIKSKIGGSKIGHGRSSFLHDDLSMLDYIISGAWNNSADEITQIRIDVIGGGLLTGRLTISGLL